MKTILSKSNGNYLKRIEMKIILSKSKSNYLKRIETDL